MVVVILDAKADTDPPVTAVTSGRGVAVVGYGAGRGETFWQVLSCIP